MAAPLIPESGSVILHVWTSGTTILDTVSSNVWTMSGTVPFSASSNRNPPSMGPFSSANYFFSGTGNDRADTAVFTVAVLAKRPSAGTYASPIYDRNASAGWDIYFTPGTSKLQFQAHSSEVQTNGSPTAGEWMIILGGHDSSGKGWIKHGSGSAVSGGLTLSPATSDKLFIGVYGAATYPWQSQIAEVYVTDVSPTSASLEALYRAISGALATYGDASVNVTATQGVGSVSAQGWGTVSAFQYNAIQPNTFQSTPSGDVDATTQIYAVQGLGTAAAVNSTGEKNVSVSINAAQGVGTAADVFALEPHQILSEDANVLMHTWVVGGRVTDAYVSTSLSGSPPFVTRTIAEPEGFGPTNYANCVFIGSGSDVLDFPSTGTLTVAIIFKPNDPNPGSPITDGAYTVISASIWIKECSGWWLEPGANSTYFYQPPQGPGNWHIAFSTPINRTTNLVEENTGVDTSRLNLIVFGVNGATASIQSDISTYVTNSLTPTSGPDMPSMGSSVPLILGSQLHANGLTGSFNGVIYEVYATRTPPSPELFQSIIDEFADQFMARCFPVSGTSIAAPLSVIASSSLSITYVVGTGTVASVEARASITIGLNAVTGIGAVASIQPKVDASTQIDAVAGRGELGDVAASAPGFLTSVIGVGSVSIGASANINYFHLFDQDANAVTHVYFSASKLTDLVGGNTWNTGVGGFTPTYPFEHGRPQAVSGFSAGKAIQAANNLGDLTGSFTLALAVKQLPLGNGANQGIPFSNGEPASTGYYVGWFMNTVNAYDWNVAGNHLAAADGTPAQDQVAILIAGRSGTTSIVRTNGGSFFSATVGTASSTLSMTLGGYAPNLNSYAFQGSIYELYITRTPPTTASMNELYLSASSTLYHANTYTDVSVGASGVIAYGTQNIGYEASASVGAPYTQGLGSLDFGVGVEVTTSLAPAQSIGEAAGIYASVAVEIAVEGVQGAGAAAPMDTSAGASAPCTGAEANGNVAAVGYAADAGTSISYIEGTGSVETLGTSAGAQVGLESALGTSEAASLATEAGATASCTAAESTGTAAPLGLQVGSTVSLDSVIGTGSVADVSAGVGVDVPLEAVAGTGVAASILGSGGDDAHTSLEAVLGAGTVSVSASGERNVEIGLDYVLGTGWAFDVAANGQQYATVPLDPTTGTGAVADVSPGVWVTTYLDPAQGVGSINPVGWSNDALIFGVQGTGLAALIAATQLPTVPRKIRGGKAVATDPLGGRSIGSLLGGRSTGAIIGGRGEDNS